MTKEIPPGMPNFGQQQPTQSGGVQQMNDNEARAAFAHPAVFVNRAFAAMGPSGLRLSFSEQGLANEVPVFRAGVIMSYEDAVNLHTLLGQLLKR